LKLFANSPVYLIRAATFFSVLAFWELAARSGHHQLFPPPSQVTPTLCRIFASGQLIRDCAVSVQRVAVGYAAGCLVAIPLGILTGRIWLVDQSLGVLVQLFRPLPPLVLSIFVLLWLGFGEIAKYTVVGFGVFFPVYIAAYNGIRNVDTHLVWAASSLGASRWRLFYTVLLPASIRQIITGMRIAIASGFTCLVGAEIAGASSGLIYRIEANQLAYDVEGMIAGLVSLGVLGAAADYLFVKAVHLLVPWYELS
jgi:ABC-type nitrate/sulfonate/bicarbonate transport system permease component